MAIAPTPTALPPAPISWDPRHGPQSLSRPAGHALAIALFWIPTIAVLLLLGPGPAFLCGALILASAVKIVRTATVLVVERAGLFWDVKVPNRLFFGIRLVWPLIDRIIHEDDFLQKQVRLFVREKADSRGNIALEDIQIDFSGFTAPGDTGATPESVGGASTPIEAYAWYQLGKPADIESGNWSEVRKQVYVYVYRVRFEERAPRVREIFENAFRPILEACTLAQAQKKLTDLARDAVIEAGDPLAQIGIYPFPGKGITTRDIELPPALIELRERLIRGQVDAEERISLYRSFHEPLVQMKENLKKNGMPFSDEQIMTFFLNQKILETIGTTKSNVSLVSPDVGGMLKTFTVGSGAPSPVPSTPPSGSTAP